MYGGPDTQYWAVAPNLPGNVNKSGPITEIIDGRSTTYRAQEFATYWDDHTLGPNSVYWHPLRQQPDGNGIREGDLVFRVPMSADTFVAGLALVTYDDAGRATVVQVAAKQDWMHQVDESAF